MTTSRQRVITSLNHSQPDRTPVDFLATPEIWDQLSKYFSLNASERNDALYFEPSWEKILDILDVDCRVVSYDQFCFPPDKIRSAGSIIDWWNSFGRSTPGRMWRQVHQNGILTDIWGRKFKTVATPTGHFEELADFPLSKAQTISDLRSHPWPEPDWFDFSSIQDVLKKLDTETERHIRFRIGSVFEIAWQLRGMEQFMIDLATQPEIPMYIMDRLSDIYIENTKRVLESGNKRIDMVYLYDDLASQNNLLLSVNMWRTTIRPRQARIIEAARQWNIPVMYHTDGAAYKIIPELIDMGVEVLNPLQPGVKGMEFERLKSEFGDKLSFHGGIDIVKTLPSGSEEDVRNEIRENICTLGKDGGYIMASSHHIQAGTPLENILAMYEPHLR
jgi:uroporphyrinogen decarboxylase